MNAINILFIRLAYLIVRTVQQQVNRPLDLMRARLTQAELNLIEANEQCAAIGADQCGVGMCELTWTPAR